MTKDIIHSYVEIRDIVRFFTDKLTSIDLYKSAYHLIL